MIFDVNQQAFFALVRAGLWEKDVQLASFEQIDFNEVYRLAEEQSVVGVVAAGLEHVVDIKAPQEIVLQLVGQTLQLEQKNSAMNAFIAKVINYLRNADVYTLLVKGQGIAQCYERPLWRACGDIDLLLSDSNYVKAKALLESQAINVEPEFSYFKHIGMTIEGWEVELHGTMRSRLSRRIDKEIDNIQKDIFYSDNVRSWNNQSTTVFLPAPDNDVIFVFTHILHHYYLEGIGLRQICDWCRLLWVYRDSIDVQLLEHRLRNMRIMTEWNAFAALSVNYLGMPQEAMPLYNPSSKWEKKANRICTFIIDCGNFGYKNKIGRKDCSNYIVGKVQSIMRHLRENARHFMTFPYGSVRTFNGVISSGLYALKRGE